MAGQSCDLWWKQADAYCCQNTVDDRQPEMAKKQKYKQGPNQKWKEREEVHKSNHVVADIDNIGADEFPGMAYKRLVPCKKNMFAVRIIHRLRMPAGSIVLYEIRGSEIILESITAACKVGAVRVLQRFTEKDIDK